MAGEVTSTVLCTSPVILVLVTVSGSQLGILDLCSQAQPGFSKLLLGVRQTHGCWDSPMCLLCWPAGSVRPCRLGHSCHGAMTCSAEIRLKPPAGSVCIPR